MAKRSNTQPEKPQKSIPPVKYGLLKRCAWALFAIGLLLYANTLLHDYTVDDAIVIYDNEFTTKGVAGISSLLKYDTFRGFFKVAGKESLVSGGRYRPLTPVMYAVEVEMFSQKKKDSNGQTVRDKDGEEVFDPNQNGERNTVKFVGHLINALLYGLTGTLLFHLLLLLLSSSGKVPSDWKNPSMFVAFGTALLFLAHPVHTEVVANVKGRDEILSLLGALAGLYFSLKSFHEKKPALNLLGAGLFFLALFSKENAIAFVAVVPLAFYFFTKANASEVVVKTLPFFLLALLFVFIRGNVLGWGLTGELPRELMNNPFLKLVGNQYVDFSFGEKMATVFYTLGCYVKLLFVPHPLSHDYYPRAVGIMGFSDWQVVLSALTYFGMGLYALVRLPKKDPVSFGILFYLGTLFLVSNIPFPIGTNMNERFLYMPSVGACFVMVYLFHRFFNKKLGYKNLALAGAAVVVVFSLLTVVRNFAWKDNFTLFLTDIKTVPNSAKLRNACGGELITQALKPANADRKNALITEAVPHLQEAVKIHPGYKNPFLLLGNAYNYLQQYEASIQAYQQALRLDPNYAEAKSNLAITFRDAGRYYGEQRGDLNKALEYLSKAYEMQPTEYETLRLMGVAYGVGGQVQKAIEFFEKALQQSPNDADAMYNLGTAYMNAGQTEQGQFYINKAVETKPGIVQERQR